MNPLAHKNWNRTISWVISGARDIRKSGTGTITLSGANTFTGGVIVAAGVLSSTAHNSTASASGLGAATNNISIAAGATLELAATGGRTTLMGNISGAGNVSQNNGASFGCFLGGDNSGFSGTYTAQSSAVGLNFLSTNSGSELASWVFLQSGVNSFVNARYGSSPDAWATGITSGSNPTIKLGSVSSSSSNMYLSNTATNASLTANTTWEIGNLGTNATVAAAVTDTYVGSTAFASAKTNIKKIGTGTLTLTGTNTYTGVTTFAGGTISTSSLANGGNNSNIGAATNAASNLVFDGGTLKYTGGTASTDRAFTVNAGGGTIDGSGSGAMMRSGAPTFASGAGALTLTGTTSGNVFSAVIAGGADGKITKEGSGSWTLSANNTYTGMTTVNAGTLKASGAPTLGALSIASGATFESSGASALITGAVTGSGAILKSAGSDLEFTGDLSAYSGTITCQAGNTYLDLISGGSSTMSVVTGTGSAGQIVIGNYAPASASGTYKIGALSGGGYVKAPNTGIAGTITLEIGGANTDTNYSGTMAEDGTLKHAVTKVGTGILTLSNTNQQTGATNINAGTLRISSAAALGSGLTVDANSGGTLDYTVNTFGVRTATANTGSIINKGGFAHTGTVFVNNGGVINS